MKLNRVLVVFKRRIGGMEAGARPRAGLARWQRLHEGALARVEGALAKRSIDHRVIDRSDLRAGPSCDLIIAVGGDGTLLSAAHCAGAIPLLGVNSMPGRSVGFFCAATARDAEGVIADILRGRRHPAALPLLEAVIDGRSMPIRGLNDILFAAASPAEMARYEIIIAGKREGHRSSGIWITAGPGSTAAILAAGGRRQPISSARLQFLVREPHRIPGRNYRLLRGLLPEGGRISLIPEGDNGVIFIDGSHHTFPVPAGSRCTCRVSRRRLKLFL